MSMLDDLQEKVKKKNARIIFPEADDKRILEATSFLAKNKILIPILVGNEKKIKATASKNKISLDGVMIIQSDNRYASEFFRLRKKKGVTQSQAIRITKEPIYYGMMMLKKGEADGLVSGAAHPTAHTLRPAFQLLKTTNKASSHFLMIRKSCIMLFADCGVIVEPTYKELADITIATVESAKTYDVKPKVAMLSFSTKGSGKHPETEKVKKATQIVKKKFPALIIDGEVQADAAIVPRVAAMKNPDSKLKGDANVLIFPNLNSGNIAYKLVQYLGGFQAIGPIVQGLEKPVNDLSRGCSVKDIIAVAVITALQIRK